MKMKFINFAKTLILIILPIIFLFYISVIEVIPTIWLIIKSYFDGSFLKLSFLTEAVQDVMYVHASLMSSIFLILLFILFSRKINLFTFALLVFCGFYLPVYTFLDLDLHPFLFEHGFYNIINSNGSSQINPQYTRIFTFLISIAALTLIILFKKQRTIDRSFIWLISFVSIIVLFIFHIAIPMGMLKYTKLQRLGEFTELMYQIPVKQFCSNRDCVLASDNGVIKQEYFNSGVDNNIYLSKVSNIITYMSENPSMNQFVDYDGDFIGTKTTFYSCIKNDNSIFCAIDNQYMKHYGQYSQLWFAFLTLCAHYVWLFLGGGMLFLHKFRKVKKVFNPAP